MSIRLADIPTVGVNLWHDDVPEKQKEAVAKMMAAYLSFIQGTQPAGAAAGACVAIGRTFVPNDADNADREQLLLRVAYHTAAVFGEAQGAEAVRLMQQNLDSNVLGFRPEEA